MIEAGMITPRGIDSDGALRGRVSLQNFATDEVDSFVTKEDANGLVLEWTNVNYSVQSRKAGILQVLKNLTGRVTPGRVLAILGPSGSGKTSLLNILSGRLKNGVEGDISINGCSIDPAEFRSEVAYVTQEDVHTPLQSVREALHFSAALRLSSEEISKEKQEILVNKLIEELMLTKCADTYIGGGRIRGVSGGERKRVSIAQELITRPKIIFLDEPTSGLDAYSAYSIISLLKRLAKSKNMTAICTVHQPSSEIFVEFDDCLLLHDGNCVYNASVKGINSYFADLGQPCPSLYNPADHILFLVQTTSEEKLNQFYEAWVPHNKKVLAQIDVSRQEANGKDCGIKRRRMKGFCTQFKNVLIRDWRNVYRNKIAFVIRFGINFIQQTIIGCVFWRVGLSDIEPHFGAVVLFSVSSMFSTAQVVLLSFALERAVFSRDYQNGSYGAAAWVLSKSLVEIPTLLVLNAFIFFLFILYMQLQGNYLLLVLLSTALGFCASSMAMVLGTIGKDANSSLELAPLLYVPQILFAGFFIPITQIPAILRWGQWLCFLKYGINMLMIVELFDEDETDKQQVFGKLDIEESNWALYLSVLLMIPVVTRMLAAFFAARAADSAYDNV